MPRSLSTYFPEKSKTATSTVARGPGERESPSVPLAISQPERKTPATPRPRTLSDAIDARRGTGPRPTGRGTDLPLTTVARGKTRRARIAERSPRDLPTKRKTAATQKPRTLSDAIDARRGTGPRPTGRGADLPLITVARGPLRSRLQQTCVCRLAKARYLTLTLSSLKPRCRDVHCPPRSTQLGEAQDRALR